MPSPLWGSAAGGFSKLSKGLASVLLLGFLVPELIPWTLDYLALIPAKTVPFVWSIVTAGYVEQSFFGLVISTLGLLYSGKLLEPIWTSREYLKFIIFVNAFTMTGVYVVALTFFYIKKRAEYLYVPLSGFHGVLSGFLVGVKQVIPDVELVTLCNLHLRAEWLPSIFVLVCIILSFVTSTAINYLPFVLFGSYGGWLYIRYFQRDAEVNLTGYPVDEFAFSTFFPPFMRPIVDFISSGFDKLLCGKHAYRRDSRTMHNAESSSTTSYDTSETRRWRERGARALDAKLQVAEAEDDAGKGEATSLV